MLNFPLRLETRSCSPLGLGLHFWQSFWGVEPDPQGLGPGWNPWPWGQALDNSCPTGPLEAKACQAPREPGGLRGPRGLWAMLVPVPCVIGSPKWFKHSVLDQTSATDDAANTFFLSKLRDVVLQRDCGTKFQGNTLFSAAVPYPKHRCFVNKISA